MLRDLKQLSVSQLKDEVDRLREQYDQWKEVHPNQQDEEVINRFLLIKKELEKRGQALLSKATDLDLDVQALTEIAKIKPIPWVPTDHTFSDKGALERPHKCKYCDNFAVWAVIFAGQAFIPACEEHKEKAIHEVENKDKVEEIMPLPEKSAEYAPVNSSGKGDGDVIKLTDIEDLFDNFVISTPMVFLVGGVVTHSKDGTEGDIDVLINIPSHEELERIIQFRIYRMFPEGLRERLHLLCEEKGGLSPFTDFLGLYRLVMERIPDAEIVKMGEEDLYGEIVLRTKGTEKQAQEANKAAKNDKITFNKFFLPQKPCRGFIPDQAQTLEFFLSLWKDKQFPVYSSRKADGINTIWHISKDGKTKAYTEDGTDETSSFPETIEEAKKLAPGHSIILLAETEWWEGNQHFPREVAAGKIHQKHPDETGIVINVYDLVYYDEDIHKKSYEERWKILKELKFPQTTELPDTKYNWNLIPHIKNSNREELKKETERLSKLNGSEGNVAKQASAPYDLAAKRATSWIKFHNSTTFTAIVLDAIETKTKGVFNLEWAILAGNRPIREKDARIIDGKKAVFGGKTFSTKQHPARGSGILIECETFNVTYYQKEKAFDVSAWSPRFMGTTDKSPQTIDQIEAQAIKDRVFQAKIVDEGGKIHYLPGKSGEKTNKE